jgi:TrmH family RNA methyltransferase
MESKMEKLTSRRNPVCVHLKKLGAEKSYREEHKLFLCNGEKLLFEALKSNAGIEIILTSKEITYTLPAGARVYGAQSSLIDSLSPLVNSQGLMFACRFPNIDKRDFTNETNLLLDNIQDPGNVGTIMRSACAFGIGSVILTKGSADPYNPKSIRASMGAIFNQHHCYMNIDGIIKLKKAGARFIGTSNTGDCTDVIEANLDGAIIVLGNEGQGVSGELLALCDDVVTIPLSPGCESLNVAVAASILMWEANGKRSENGGKQLCHP